MKLDHVAIVVEDIEETDGVVKTASISEQYKSIKNPVEKFTFYKKHKQQLLNTAFKK